MHDDIQEIENLSRVIQLKGFVNCDQDKFDEMKISSALEIKLCTLTAQMKFQLRRQINFLKKYFLLLFLKFEGAALQKKHPRRSNLTKLLKISA